MRTPKSSNASSISFGWQFQVNAAIYLMLSFIKEAEAVRVEGATEDIEIYLKGNKINFAQAKSVVDASDFSHSTEKLTEALRTLNNASQNPQSSKLIFVTNSSNPLACNRCILYFSGAVKRELSELPPVCRSVIEKIIERNSYSDINLNMFEIWILPFAGRSENRFVSLKTYIDEFLRELDVEPGLGSKVLQEWQQTFLMNSTLKDTAIKISKEEMIWPLVVFVCESDNPDNLLDDFDEGVQAEVLRSYSSFMSTKSENFLFANKVIQEFENPDYRQDLHTRPERVNCFLEDNWKQFSEDFRIDELVPEILELLVKLVLKRIIAKRYKIKKIRKGVEL